MLNRRHFISATATATAWSAQSAFSQNSGNVSRICNGFPAGSSADSLSRVLAVKLGAGGSSYIVENRAGAGGRLAPENIKSSPADGKSMLVTPDAMMMLYPHIYKKLNYDPVNDFRAVTTLGTVPLALAVGPMVPASVQTLAEFAQWCRANSSAASFATSGAGTTLHFTGVMFAKASGIELTHVPYRGGNLAAQDVAAGQIASCVTVLSDVHPFFSAGKVRLLGISSAERSSFAPNVQTFREQGFKQLEWITWYGLFVPVKTPDARVAALYSATVEAFKKPDVAESLSKFAMVPSTMPSRQFAAMLKSNIERWGQVVKEVGYVGTE